VTENVTQKRRRTLKLRGRAGVGSSLQRRVMDSEELETTSDGCDRWLWHIAGVT